MSEGIPRVEVERLDTSCRCCEDLVEGRSAEEPRNCLSCLTGTVKNAPTSVEASLVTEQISATGTLNEQNVETVNKEVEITSKEDESAAEQQKISGVESEEVSESGERAIYEILGSLQEARSVLSPGTSLWASLEKFFYLYPKPNPNS